MYDKHPMDNVGKIKLKQIQEKLKKKLKSQLQHTAMGHIHRVEVGHSQQKASIMQSVSGACSHFNLSDYNADLTLTKKVT